MTIGEYIQQINALTPAEIATAAIDENGEEIVSYTERSWVSGINPDGQSLSNATWEGSEVSSAYREKWNIYNGTYNYRFINISGDTRRGLQVRGGRIFSTTDYWGSILRNFNNAGFRPYLSPACLYPYPPKGTQPPLFSDCYAHESHAREMFSRENNL